MSKRLLMWIGCGVMVAGGIYFLWAQGYNKIASYAVLLLCPLIHLVMHNGHKHNHGSGGSSNEANSSGRSQSDCH